MATTFLEPGGDADFLVGTTNGFWAAILNTTPTIVTDFVHGGHQKSIKHAVGVTSQLQTANNVVVDSGSRISVYIYIVAYPTGGNAESVFSVQSTSVQICSLAINPTGNLIIWKTAGSQIGSSSSQVLSLNTWYRVSLSYTVTSTTINRFEAFINGVSAVSITNATITNTGGIRVRFGSIFGAASFDTRMSDFYIDNSSSLTDTGNIWVTAKRPVSNGTTNGFTTQIGSSGSGYGTGHSPQVNERPLSTTNGWSMVGAGSAVTEEYNVEGKAVGDIDISAATIVDWLGWASLKALAGETGNIIIDGSSVAQAITTTAALYTKIKGSTTYPAGTGADIGITTDTSLTTVSLYECGVLVAYIPAAAPAAPKFTFWQWFPF